MVGPGLMVAPVLHAGQKSLTVYLPATDLWYGLHTALPHKGGQNLQLDTSDLSSIPVFVRGGHIIPRRERPRRSTAAMANDPYTLLVALDQHGYATGALYEDDGITTAHKNGAFIHRQFVFENNTLRSFARMEGAGRAIYTSSNTIERIVIMGMDTLPKQVLQYLEAPEGRGAALEVELGPVSPPSLDLAPAANLARAVVIRKPDLPLASNWVLHFTM